MIPHLSTDAPSLTQRGADALFLAVRAFQQMAEQPAPAEPTLVPEDRVNVRDAWIASELKEVREAKTVVDQADGYLDVIYLALGGLVETGVLPGILFDNVQTANMAKGVRGEDGAVRVVKDATGKVTKPAGWQAPEPKHAAEVARQITERPLKA